MAGLFDGSGWRSLVRQAGRLHHFMKYFEHPIRCIPPAIRTFASCERAMVITAASNETGGV